MGDQSWVWYLVLLYQSCEPHLLIHMPMEWIFPSQGSSVLHACMLSHVQLFSTTWTVAHQAPLSVEFSRQEQWNGLPFPSPGHQVLNKYQIILHMSYCLTQAIQGILHYHFHFADEHLVLRG